MWIQNQDNRTITHNGRAGNALEVPKVGSKGLDDYFLPFQQPVHDQAKAAVIIVNDHNGKHIGEGITGAGQSKHFCHFNNTKHLTAQCDGLAALYVGKALGLDLIANPDLLLEYLNAARSAAWYWKANGCNELADKGDFLAITRRINPPAEGQADRVARLNVAKAAL